MSYKGVGLFPGYDSDLPTQLWIISRIVLSGSLLAAPFLAASSLDLETVLAACLLAPAGLILAAFKGWFPVCYVEGVGLTRFKRASELVICLAFLAGAALLHRYRAHVSPRVLRLLLAAIALDVAAELLFTFYVGVYDLSNVLGHLVKVVSYWCIYKALVELCLKEPYELLFLDQRRRAAALEATVEARTSELSAAYAELQHRSDELELLVGQRTEENKRSREEAERRASEIEAAFSSMLDGVALFGRDGTVKAINEAARDLLGCTPGDKPALPEWIARLPLSRPDGSPYVPGERPLVRAMQGETVRGEELLVHRDGASPCVLSVNASPVRTTGGNPAGAITVWRDVTGTRPRRPTGPRASSWRT
jgi:PAS domain-containing protein